MNEEFHIKREKALRWWNDLRETGHQVPQYLCEKYFKTRDSATLTGREIEIIYKKENSIKL